MSVTGLARSIARGTTPAGPVAVARAIVGTAAAAKAVYLATRVLPRLGPETIRAPFLESFPEASVATIGPLLVAWLVAAACFAMGTRTRLSGATLLAAMVGFVALDQQFYSNHLYLLVLTVFLLTLADSGAAHSLDARRMGGRAMIPRWPVTLLCAQLSVVYGYAAIAKLRPEFLSGMIIYENWVVQGVVPLPEALRQWWVMMPLGVATCLVEVFLAVGFWYPRLRKAAVVAGVALHAGIIPTMGDVVDLSVFAALMFAVYVVFVGWEPGGWRAAEKSEEGRSRAGERRVARQPTVLVPRSH